MNNLATIGETRVAPSTPSDTANYPLSHATVAGLSGPDEEPLPRHLVEAYDNKLVGTLDCIQQAMEENNYEAICHIAHRLAGSSGMYGRPRLSLVARVMLHASRCQSLVALTACLFGARQLAAEARRSACLDYAT